MAAAYLFLHRHGSSARSRIRGSKTSALYRVLDLLKRKYIIGLACLLKMMWFLHMTKYQTGGLWSSAARFPAVSLAGPAGPIGTSAFNKMIAKLIAIPHWDITAVPHWDITAVPRWDWDISYPPPLGNHCSPPLGHHCSPPLGHPKLRKLIAFTTDRCFGILAAISTTAMRPQMEHMQDLNAIMHQPHAVYSQV